MNGYKTPSFDPDESLPGDAAQLKLNEPLSLQTSMFLLICKGVELTRQTLHAKQRCPLGFHRGRGMA
jgi:hypothetical protein